MDLAIGDKCYLVFNEFSDWDLVLRLKRCLRIWANGRFISPMGILGSARGNTIFTRLIYIPINIFLFAL